MELAEHIQKLAEKHLQSSNQFIVDVIASIRKKPLKLIVIVDGDQGITIDDCADISRALSDELDKSNLIDDRYMLEVSTPGLDHPLKLKRQYVKNIGRNIRVKRKADILEGLLKAVTETEITLEQQSGKGKKKEVKDVAIPFTEIDKTFVLVSFK